jgi:hypothetical protein
MVAKEIQNVVDDLLAPIERKPITQAISSLVTLDELNQLLHS